MCVDVCPSHYDYRTSVFSPSCAQKVSALTHDLKANSVQSKINDVLRM